MTAQLVFDEAHRAQVRKLLKLLAVEVRPCQACKREIYFVRTTKGAKLPVTDDAVSHWADCPEAERFRRERKAK